MLGIICMFAIPIAIVLLIIAVVKMWGSKIVITLVVIIGLAIVGMLINYNIEKQQSIDMVNESMTNNGGVPIEDYTDDVIDQIK